MRQFIPKLAAECRLERTSFAICGDGSGWLPYHFEKERKVIDYNIDVLEAVFSPLGLTITVNLPP